MLSILKTYRKGISFYAVLALASFARDVSAQTAALTSSPSGSYAFDDRPTGGAASSQTITIQNVGAVAATSVSISSSLSPPLSFGGGSCSGSIPPGGSCTIVVNFLPTSSGTFSGGFSVLYNNGMTMTAMSYSVSGASNDAVNTFFDDAQAMMPCLLNTYAFELPDPQTFVEQAIIDGEKHIRLHPGDGFGASRDAELATFVALVNARSCPVTSPGSCGSFDPPTFISSVFGSLPILALNWNPEFMGAVPVPVGGACSFP